MNIIFRNMCHYMALKWIIYNFEMNCYVVISHIYVQLHCSRIWQKNIFLCMYTYFRFMIHNTTTGHTNVRTIVMNWVSTTKWPGRPKMFLLLVVCVHLMTKLLCKDLLVVSGKPFLFIVLWRINSKYTQRQMYIWWEIY